MRYNSKAVWERAKKKLLKLNKQNLIREYKLEKSFKKFKKGVDK